MHLRAYEYVACRLKGGFLLPFNPCGIV